MANNEYVNRVDFGDETLIDISDTTAEPEDVIEGQVFYTKSGAPATGTLGDATTIMHGLMSAADKVKLDEMDSKKAPIIINSKSGNPIVINDGVFGLKLYDMKVSFTPKQEGSGDPSPTNIRPIMGWNGINIHRSGKNLVQFNSQQGPRATFYNGYSGWLTNGSWRIPDMSIKYTYSAYINNRNASESSCAKIWFYGADGTTSAGITEGTQIAAGAEGWSVVSFSNNANLYFAAFGLGLQAGGVATQGMVEIGESRTEYVPYSGESYHIEFPVQGKNLLHVDDKWKLSFNSMYSNWTSENGVVTITDSATGGYIMPCSPSTQYSYSFMSTYIGDELAMRVYEFAEYPTSLSAGTLILNDNTSTGRNVPPARFTTTEAGRWLIVGFYGHHGSGNNITITNMQIEIGATTTAYEPYTNTIYGGTLDVLTGILTATHKFIDLTSISSNLWTKSTSYPGGFYCNIQTGNLGIKAQTDFICSHAKTAHIISNYEYGTCYCDGSINIRIMGSGSEKTDWVAYLAEQSQNGTPVCICAQLAEPFTVQLDPVTMSTLINTNTIWTDADTVEIAYPIDTKKYVDAGARDVQIDGNSIINNGIANIPYATNTTPGLIMTSGQVSLGSDHKLWINNASDANIKSGTSTTSYLTPSRQDISTFYGLAKAAGANLANETVTFGQYPESAKVAIQKMLGIYEAPWELINEITTTEDQTEILISTDSYGESFELEKAICIFEAGPSTTGKRDSFYGQYQFINLTTGYTNGDSFPSLQYPTATSTIASKIEFDINKSMAPVSIRVVSAVDNGNTQNLTSMVKKNIIRGVVSIRIYQANSNTSLIPAGAKVTLYGKRVPT